MPRPLHLAWIPLVALFAACGAPSPPPATFAAEPKVQPTPAPAAIEAATPGRPALLDALARSDDARERALLLKKIAVELGAAGLVAALDFVKDAPEDRAWLERAAIFGTLHQLVDPRAGDAIVQWLESAPRPVHWQGEAGIALAEIGDLRGAPYLAERLRHEPAELYPPEAPWKVDPWATSREDRTRIVAARMLHDLAVLHPDAKDRLRAAAEDAVLAWVKSAKPPSQHAFDFLAAVGSTKALPELRAAAFPPERVRVDASDQPYPGMALDVAQGAASALGLARDEPSYPKLLAELRRTRTVDAQGAFGARGKALLAVKARGVRVGAARGLGRWGDPRATKPLVAVIEDASADDDVRLAACSALARCADAGAMASVLEKAKKLAAETPARSQFLATCYARALAAHPAPGTAALAAAIAPGLRFGLADELARAVAASPIDAATERKLFDQLAVNESDVRRAAALALLLGGSREAAARAAASIAAFDPRALKTLRSAYRRSLAGLHDDDVPMETLLRWVENAEAAGRSQPTLGWLAADLASRLGVTVREASFAVVIRHRLFELAKSSAPSARAAVTALWLMRAGGALQALAELPGDVGQTAKARLGGATPSAADRGDD
jgi:hypothetical protein